MSPTLAAVAGWNTGSLSAQAGAIRAAETEMRGAAADLQTTLDLLPTVWTGVAAAATRDALRGERQLLVDQADALAGLAGAYDSAHTALTEKLGVLRDCLDRYRGGPITVDIASPAEGPITVRGETVRASDSNRAIGLGETDLAAVAAEVAAAAGAVLDADLDGARAIRAEGTKLRYHSPVEGTTAPVDALLATHGSNLVPDFPLLGYDQDRVLRDLLLADVSDTVLPSAEQVLGLYEDFTEFRDNRRSAGDIAVDLVQDSISLAGPPLPRSMRVPLEMLMSGAQVAAPDVMDTWNLPGRAVDATVRPVGRWIDQMGGWGLFHQDADLGARAEQDQKRFGGN